MKKPLKIILFIVLGAAIAGFGYWQYNKRRIVKDAIRDAVAKGSDSLYYLKYDSSEIDELNGRVAFYNVVLQSDQAQQRLLNSLDSLPNALYNIRVQKIEAAGIDVPGLLQQENVAAGRIVLMRPVIRIINTGADKPRPFTKEDTLALYKKLLGNLKSIRADTVEVQDGSLLVTNKEGKMLAHLNHINIQLNKFLIDESKDYQNIISYFIKDVRVTVDSAQLPVSKNNTRVQLEGFKYDALKRSLHVGAIKQFETGQPNPISNLSNIDITDLNTDAFILQQRLRAGLIKCDGGLITLYTSAGGDKDAGGEKSIRLSSDVIDQAQISGIELGNTRLVVLNRDRPGSSPLVLDNARFKVLTPVKIMEGSTVNNLLNNAEWDFAADGFSYTTKDKLYDITIGNFKVNSKAKTAYLKEFRFKPKVNETQFGKIVKLQMDQYNLVISNIRLSGLNIQRFLSDKELEVEQAIIQPQIRIFNDKTLPAESRSMLGEYPHQKLQRLKFPFYVKTLKIENATVSYREKAEKSELVGNVLFTNVNATISNLTNIPARWKTDPNIVLNAKARFLNQANLTTRWVFPMNATNGAFTISGALSSMSAQGLNVLIEPIALASAEKGQIDKLEFNMEGNNNKTNARVLFLYRDLKVNMMKRGDDAQLKKKGFVSALANSFLKNENIKPENDKKFEYERDLTRSFFNLVWKTIFTGVKNTAFGKKSDESKAP